jgi:3-hydroxy-3-methylglutaryl CoA synthase
VPTLGNTYSGASPLGLTAVLDIAKPGDKVLMCSYGSGSGSDAFVMTITDRITVYPAADVRHGFSSSRANEESPPPQDTL